jgi:prophage regulatory protein
MGAMNRTNLHRKENQIGVSGSIKPIAHAERLEDSLPRLPRFMRKPEVRQAVGLSDTTIWRLEKRNKFPQRFEIIPGIVAWLEEDIRIWIEQKVRKTSGKVGA